MLYLYLRLKNILDERAELDEKALLIALFVLAAVVGLTPLGQKVAQTFSNISAQL